MKKLLIILCVLFLLAAAGVVFFVLPLGTCDVGSGNPFSKNYTLVKDEPHTPGSVSMDTISCSLYQSFRHEVIVIRM